MAGGRNLGATLLLLFLILAISAGGVVWFDYLGVIDMKNALAPVYRLLGKEVRSQPPAEKGEPLSLDAERFAVLLEGIDLQKAALEKRGEELETRRGELMQMAAELEERQKGLDEREKSLTQSSDDAEARDRNIEQFATYLTNMPPDAAVRILVAMDDQQVIDLFMKVEQLARASGAGSLVPVWLMNAQMPPARAADLSRKMAERR